MWLPRILLLSHNQLVTEKNCACSNQSYESAQLSSLYLVNSTLHTLHPLSSSYVFVLDLRSKLWLVVNDVNKKGDTLCYVCPLGSCEPLIKMVLHRCLFQVQLLFHQLLVEQVEELFLVKQVELVSHEVSFRNALVLF